MLHRLTKDLRLVQKQLGHSSSQITEVYADVLDEDIEKAINLLYV
jgi:integrase